MSGIQGSIQVQGPRARRRAWRTSAVFAVMSAGVRALRRGAERVFAASPAGHEWAPRADRFPELYSVEARIAQVKHEHLLKLGCRAGLGL